MGYQRFLKSFSDWIVCIINVLCQVSVIIRFEYKDEASLEGYQVIMNGITHIACI